MYELASKHGHLQLRGSSRSLIEELGQMDQIPSNQFFVEKSKSGSRRTELIIPKSIEIDNPEGIPHKEESLKPYKVDDYLPKAMSGCISSYGIFILLSSSY
ncbi:hypothetical protein LOK49_LG03G02751 [Camellia lanceoleosa]|uniref:Uncharacterized protein n=1 Tax=Camellia lanceoleosa TaxID=1840588 RepID=A0ACC0IEB5_9ERIC|nr:hypothetical protein LOK49_LG03G02751 [Camellia lanceoleosa]